MANAGNIKGVVGENLRKALDWLPTGRVLVTVKCDVALPFDFDTIDHKERDIAKLDKLYEGFGFKGMRAALHKGGGGSRLTGDRVAESSANAVFKQAEKDSGATRWSGGSPLPGVGEGGEAVTRGAEFINSRNYETIATVSQLEKWLNKLNAADLAALDTETTSLDPMAAQIVGLSFAVIAGEAAYLPLRHIYPGAPDQLDFESSIATLRPWLEDA